MTEQEYQERMEAKARRIAERNRKKRQSKIILGASLALIAILCAVIIIVKPGSSKKTESVPQTAESSGENLEGSKETSSAGAEGEPSPEPEESEEALIIEPPAEESDEESSEESSEPEPVTMHANIAAIGDIMAHREQLEDAYNWDSGSFNFEPSYAMIRDELSAPDYTIANLETTFGGEDTWTEDRFQGYTGYPCFNSPDILAQNLKDAGTTPLTRRCRNLVLAEMA